MKAYIMEIEKFAIHDGPGIRSVVFLQGCPLRCPWCANPESQEIQSQLMYKEKTCIKCGKCIANCPQKAISVVDGQLKFDRKKCIKCETCAVNCPVSAIHFIGKSVEIENIIQEVLKDRAFYIESGGGVTISGGEPFVQFSVLKELLMKLKEEGISTAVETTGDTDWKNIEECLPYIDLFLFDVKHSQAYEIERVTKGNGERILLNLKKLASLAADKIIIRTPVIPEFNYNQTTLTEIIDLGAKYHVLQIHLLPYHTLGTSKYEQLDREYTLQGIKMLSKEDLKDYVEYGKSLGVNIQAGG